MNNLDKIIVLDLETSGLDPARHSILEFGAARLTSDDVFSLRVRLAPGAEWSQGALDVNGLTLAAITDLNLPLPYEGLMAFYDHFGWEEFLYAGQNVGSFDIPFMRAAMRQGAEHVSSWPRMRQRSLDMHSVAIAHGAQALQLSLEEPRMVAPSRLGVDVMRMDSSAIYRMLGMPDEPKPHKALNGAIWERDALRIMLGIQQPEGVL